LSFPFNTKTWAGMSEYVTAIYGDTLANGAVWTTGMVSVEGSNAAWFGASGLAHLEAKFPGMGADLYACIGVMGPGSSARGNRNVVAQPLLIVDDIGTKIDRGAWNLLFAMGFPLPTARIETSPGNETWIWALAGDATDPARWVDLAVIRAWLVDMKLTDDVMDAARYIRLPGGHNSKAKYKTGGGSGVSPPVTLVDWQECRPSMGGARVDLDAVGVALLGAARWAAREFPATAAGRSQASSAVLGNMAGLVRSADLAAGNDPLMVLGSVIGMNLVQIRPGVVEGLCPNIAAHGDRADTGFAFLGDGLMHCNHASCQELSTREFRGMMEAEFERQAAAAPGGLLEGCASASGFMARQVFSGADAGNQVLAGGVVAGVASVAQGMAVASAAAAADRALVFADGLDGLVDRYAWISAVDMFFDRVSRKLIPFGQIDRREAVLAVIPAGSSGAKKAQFQMVNHTGLVHLDAVARAAGDHRDILDIVDVEGDRTRVANIWRASKVCSIDRASLRVRRPVEWLELLAHVIPDAAYREWFLDWLAFGFQFPGKRKMTIPMFVGGQGIGKDVILWIPKLLHGASNVTTLEMHQIGANFNEWALNDLVLLNEMKFGTDGKMYNAVKGLLANAEDWVSVNAKYDRAYKARVSFSMIAMTNHLDALQGLEPDDRRFQPYISPAEKRELDFYNRRVVAGSTPEAVEGALDFLLSRDLSKFTIYTPAPGADAAKNVMAVENLTGAALWAFQSVQKGGGGRFVGRHLLSIAEVETAALADPSRRISGNVDARPLAKGLRTAGWTSLGQIGPRNDRTSVWVSPDAVSMFGGASKASARKMYDAEKLAHDALLLGNIN